MLAISNPNLLGDDDKIKISFAVKQISNKYTVLSHTF